jgi:predicted PurR-regulated permease PerM
MTHDRTPQNRRKAILFLMVLLIITLIMAYAVFRPFFPVLAYSAILATVCYPIQRYVMKRIQARWLAALISTGLLCLLIVVPLVIILNLAAGQALTLAKEIEARSASEGGLSPYLIRHVRDTTAFLGKYVDLSGIDIQGHLQAKAKGISEQLLPMAGTLAGNLVALVLNLFIGLVTTYVLLRDGDLIVSYILHTLPLTERQAGRLLETLKDNMVADVQGIFAVGAAQGLATGLALAAMGISSASLLGIVAAFCSVIPVFGTAIVWIPAAIHLIATGHLIKGLVLLGLGGGVISQLDNVVRPLIVGKKVQANALVMMIAMLGGVQAYGFLGLFIGPVVVALLIALGKMLHEEIAENPGADGDSGAQAEAMR